MSDINTIGTEPIHGGTKRMIAVPIPNLQDAWPSIRDDVAKIDNPEGNIPEDVYAMLYTNQATLFFLEVNGARVGFIVIRLIKPNLHIWLLSATNGYEVLKTFREDLMGIARNAGATKLTFGSRRKAWQQVAPDHGFKVDAIMYSCAVE